MLFLMHSHDHKSHRKQDKYQLSLVFSLRLPSVLDSQGISPTEWHVRHTETTFGGYLVHDDTVPTSFLKDLFTRLCFTRRRS